MRSSLRELLGPDEKVHFETRQHPWVLIHDAGVLLLLLLLAAGAAVYAGSADWLNNQVGGWIEIGLWIAFAVIAVLGIIKILGWWTERLYLTNSKIVYVHGIVNHNITTTPLVKIDEVTLRRPLLGRMLGFGRLDVENASGGAEPLAGLEYLPRPTELYRMVNERARDQRRLEGGGHHDDDNDGLVDPAPPAAPAPAPHVVDPASGGDWKPTGDSTSDA